MASKVHCKLLVRKTLKVEYDASDSPTSLLPGTFRAGCWGLTMYRMAKLAKQMSYTQVWLVENIASSWYVTNISWGYIQACWLAKDSFARRVKSITTIVSVGINLFSYSCLTEPLLQCQDIPVMHYHTLLKQLITITRRAPCLVLKCAVVQNTRRRDATKPGLWTLDWTVDWALDSIIDSISGLEFRSPGVKGHLHINQQQSFCL